MSHYIKFDIESEMQNQKDAPAKVANPANLGGNISNFSRFSRDTSPKTHTIADFVTNCCALAPDAKIRGAELYMALARWRRYVEAANGECVWDQLHLHLESIGCSRDIMNGPATWHGVTLKPNGPHTTTPADHQAETCSNCDSIDLYTQGPVRVCKSCKTEWLLPCPQCNIDQWRLSNSQWACKGCDYTWEPHIDLRRDLPHALTTIKIAKGRQMTLAIYKCPGCGGTNWGPRLDDAEVWHCLDCNPSTTSGEKTS